MYLFARSGVRRILCFCFVFLRLVLPVSPDCPYWFPLRYSLIEISVVLLVVVCDNDNFNSERRVWRNQRVIRIHISKKNRQHTDQKAKQRSTKQTHKTTDRVTRTPLSTGGELRCSGRISSSCSTSDTRCVNLVTNPVISHEWEKDREVFTTSGTYPWSFMTQIFHSGQPSHGGHRKTFEVMTSI
jgi:hypothetical protein